jgi:hypothetical protein
MALGVSVAADGQTPANRQEKGEGVSERRDAIAEDLRALADDFKSLLESATTDPKQRKRDERRWRVLYGALGVVTSIAARQAATKAWAILTGERPPTAKPAQAAPSERHEQTVKP